MSGSAGGETHAEPNLTPILDMVFQLITFFMLVINFKAADYDITLKLPVVGSARPVDTKGESDLLILNINSKGELNVQGRIVDNIPGYMKVEADASELLARKKDSNFKKGDDLPSTVVIRADKRTPFERLNKVITAAQEQGFRKFALKALNKVEET
jgi:biopolymer transport protein ExbD